MKVILKIPIKPYLHRFLREEIRSTDDIINIDAMSHLGTWLMGLVENTDKKPTEPKEPFILFELPIRDELGGKYDGRHGFIQVNDVNIKRFNSLIEDLMNFKLFAGLDLLEKRGESSRRSGKKRAYIHDFIQKYSCSEADLTYDMLRMRHDRWKKSGRSLLQSTFL